jgi:hypothetical protein
MTSANGHAATLLATLSTPLEPPSLATLVKPLHATVLTPDTKLLAAATIGKIVADGTNFGNMLAGYTGTHVSSLLNLNPSDDAQKQVERELRTRLSALGVDEPVIAAISSMAHSYLIDHVKKSDAVSARRT